MNEKTLGRGRSGRRWAAGLLLALAGGICLPGCNAGVALVAWLLADSGGGGGGGGGPKTQPTRRVEVVIQSVRDARHSPEKAVIALVLRNDDSTPAEVEVRVASGGGASEPATLRDVSSGRLSAPGVLSELATSPVGTLHLIGWNARADVGGDDALHEVVLTVSARGGNDASRTVLVGNDAPEIRDLAARDAGGGHIRIEFRLLDSSSDPTDVAIEYSTRPLDPDAHYRPATSNGIVERLETSSAGEAHSVDWLSIDDLGRADRAVALRVTPRDRIEGMRGKVGEPAVVRLELDNNSPPRADLLAGEFVADPDARRGVAVRFSLEDDDGDPVDAVVQWAIAGEDFPELPADLDADPERRAAQLADPTRRRELQIATLDPATIRGRVEEPSALALEADQVLATWLLAEEKLRGLIGAAPSTPGGTTPPAGLLGRPATLRPASGEPQVRRVCEFDPATGIVRVSPPFEPAARAGDWLELDLGDPSSLRATPAGVLHRLAWRSDADLPGGGSAHLRVTPFDRAADVTDGTGVACSGRGGFSAEGATVGSRGIASLNGAAKELRGPFGAIEPVVVPLTPEDVPAGLAAGDLDGDGRLDLAAATGLTRTLVVALQRVPGIFDAQRFGDARLGEPTGLALADLDGDGDLDAAVAATEAAPLPPATSLIPAGVLLFWQEAGGDFISRRTSLGAAAGLVAPAAIETADVDGDGDLDLVLADADASSPLVTVYFRGASPAGAACAPAAGGYAACSFGPDGAARDVALADLDGDGDEDLAVAREGGVTLLYSDGAGDLAAPAVEITVPGSDPRSIDVADADGDGLLDLWVLDGAGHEVTTFFQDAGGLFSARPTARLGALGRPVDLAVADVDGNGLADAVVADSGDPSAAASPALIACLAAGSGVASCDRLERVNGTAAGSPRAVAVADLDGDGRLDLLSADDEADGLVLWRQDGGGRFSAPGSVLAGPAELREPSSLAVADLDGDGRLDVAAPSLPGDRLTLALSRSGGEVLIRAVDLPLDASARAPLGIAAGDLDGDGRADLALANVDSGSVTLLRQDERGSFTARRSVLVREGLEDPEDVALADLDGDGRLDVVTAGRASNDVVVFFQDSTGEFSRVVSLELDAAAGATLDGPIAIVASDLDGDGRRDVAVAGHGSGNVVIFWQREARGVFEPGVSVPVGEGASPLGIAAGDVDADGDLDLAVASLGGAPASLLRQSDPRAFTLSAITEGLEGITPTALDLGDVDGDGRADLVVADADEVDPTIRVITGIGGGGAPVTRVLRSDDALAPAAVAIVDLDGDGEADIITANRASDTLTFFPGGR